jgi:mRNA interferase RelE/StbE
MSAKYKIRYSEKFKQAFATLTMIEKKLVVVKVAMLEDNPRHNSLRSKKVRGNPGVFEFSVNMDIRVLWRYENGQIILMLNVGHHDILKNFR